MATETDRDVAVDVAVVGGGPAGLAAAIACAQTGLSVVVLEKRSDDLDKACGEGLLPPALAALEALGARALLAESESASFHALRYILEDGTFAEATLPAGGGLGVRRTALVRALRRRAGQLGVELREGAKVGSFTRGRNEVQLEVGEASLRCRLLVGADGLGSGVREAAGLDRPAKGRGRYGLRQHFAVAPWASAVEVYFGPGVEAYVTPVGLHAVGVAFLWSHGELPPRASALSLLSRLPRLAARLGSASPASRARGAGPLERRVQRCTSDRLALIGDAAGYLDAITGEGLSLAFRAALVLGVVAPKALALGASRQSLADYERAYSTAYARYVRSTKLVLTLSRRSAVRRRVVRWLAVHRRAFESMIAWGLKG